jgi:hypothetical protein
VFHLECPRQGFLGLSFFFHFIFVISFFTNFMLAILKSKFIFSTKGLLFYAFIALILWFLRDYSQWRSKRLNTNNDSTFSNDIPTLASVKDSLSNASTLKNQANDDKQRYDSTETLSLAHYILVTFFAALYIIGRAISDALRYSTYFALWSIERSIPYIDDWLFDFVTITLPSFCNKTEHWWIQQGKPACVRTKIHLQEHTIPNTVHGLEVFFIETYKVGCIVQTSILDFIAAWKRFIDRHDWHQLATDLSDIAYTAIWVPVALIVTRTTRLCQIVYAGIRAIFVSSVNELKWIITIAIPAIYNYLISTRLANILCKCFNYTTQHLQRICILVFEYVLCPTLGRLLTWTVKATDHFIVLLQQHTIHAKLARMYRYFAPNLVWVVSEMSSLFLSSLEGARLLHRELIHPALQLMMKHVMPRLAIAYQTMVDGVCRWYEANLYPAWLKVYPYLNAPLYWIYTNLTVPVYREIYTCLAATGTYLTRHLAVHVYTSISKLMQVSATFASRVYSIIQIWLTKQAPVLAKIIHTSYEWVIHSYDWHALQRDITAMVTLFYDWIANQSNLLYLSLERSLAVWANEQEKDTVKLKKTTESITMKKLS